MIPAKPARPARNKTAVARITRVRGPAPCCHLRFHLCQRGYPGQDHGPGDARISGGTGRVATLRIAATSMDNITVSEGEGQAERAPSRRYGRQADLRPDFLHGDRTGRSARTASLADVRLCRKQCVSGMHKDAEECIESHASAGSAPPHFAPALGWEIVSAAEYERKSEVDGLIGDAPRTQRSVRPECRQATRTGAQIARGCAWLGWAAAHRRCSRCYPRGGG
jgi:hypothetical protein